MGNKFALHAVGILVLLPTTLAAAFWSLLGVGFSVAFFRTGDHVFASLLLLLAMAAGWFGIVTLWRLYYSFLSDRHPRSNFVVIWAGLACGCVTSLALIATTGGSILFRVVFFGWPLLAVALFLIALVRQPDAA